MVNDNRNLHLMVDKIHSLDINSVGKVLVDKPLSTYMKNKFIKELIKYNDLEKIDLSDLNFELKKGIVIVDNNDNIGILGARQDDGKFNSYGLTQSKENKDAILIGGYKYQIDYHKRKVIDDSDVKFFVTEGFEKLINPPKKSKQKKYKIGREVNLVGTKEKVIIIDKGKILAVDTPENLEKKVNNQNILTITIEDEKNKINDIIKEIKDVKEIKLVTENSDGTKQYTIFVEQNKDIRKEVSEKFAKNEITILELKKTEATLEEAFLQLIDNYSKKEEHNNYEKKGGKE